jgi:hypothetical protein
MFKQIPQKAQMIAKLQNDHLEWTATLYHYYISHQNANSLRQRKKNR